MRCPAEGKGRLPCLGTIWLARIVETPIESAICLIGTPIMKSRKINVLLGSSPVASQTIVVHKVSPGIHFPLPLGVPSKLLEEAIPRVSPPNAKLHSASWYCL